MEIAAEDEAGDILVVGIFGGGEGDGGGDDIFSVARNDDERAGFEVGDGVIGGHGTDDDFLDATSGAIFAIEESTSGGLGDLAKGGGGEDGFFWNRAEEIDAEAIEAPFGEVADIGKFFGEDLIDDHADDFDAFFIEEGFIEGDFIDGAADPATGDEDHLTGEEVSDAGIGEIEDGADARVASSFDDDEVLFPSGPIERILDSADEKFVIGIFDVAAGEIGFDGDGGHGVEGSMDAVGLADENGIFVDALAFNFDEALADGFDESDTTEAFAEGSEEAEGGGRFAVILLSGGEENARSHRIHKGTEGVWGGLGEIGVEVSEIDGLEADDGGDAEDIFDTGASGEIGAGFG